MFEIRRCARFTSPGPKFAILDECTSAVSKEMEGLLYTECIKLGITYITICHRPTLRVWHGLNLNLLGDGKGGYELNTLQSDGPERARIIAQCNAIKKAKLAGAYDTSKGFGEQLKVRSAKYQNDPR